jgi:hypothetical protein
MVRQWKSLIQAGRRQKGDRAGDARHGKAGSRKGKSNREAGKVRPTGIQLGKGWAKQGGRRLGKICKETGKCKDAEQARGYGLCMQACLQKGDGLGSARQAYMPRETSKQAGRQAGRQGSS